MGLRLTLWPVVRKASAKAEAAGMISTTLSALFLL